MDSLHDIVETAKNNLPKGLILKIDLMSNCQGPLYGEEENYIANFSHGRKREFIAGRTLARQALQVLGEKPCSIINDAHGCPLWPESVTGSISHKRNVCAVVMGLKDSFGSVGIDIEANEPLSKPMWDSFAVVEEISKANATGHPDEQFANMLYCAKEALYKSIFPIAQENTPPLKKFTLKINRLVNIYSLQSSNMGISWAGTLLLKSSHVLSIIWQDGKNV